jgi:hypothetical protein
VAPESGETGATAPSCVSSQQELLEILKLVSFRQS